MSKRAEQRGLEALPPRWRKTKDGKGKVDGALPVRKFYIRAYEQGEKDTIERALDYLYENLHMRQDEKEEWLDEFKREMEDE